ncbi:MAG: hypothetical protein Q8M96_07795, partial [Rubrivivax sp.]|nr:hypothetical protein [Rubrivivax sp.]
MPTQSQSQGSLPFETSAPATGAAAHALAARAMPAETGVWDELRGAAQALRPPWQAFAHSLPAPAGGMDLVDDLNRRVGQVEQRIRLDGVTHNVFTDAPDGGVATRPWSLELLPHLIEAADWKAIEAGVQQRA